MDRKKDGASGRRFFVSKSDKNLINLVYRHRLFSFLGFFLLKKSEETPWAGPRSVLAINKPAFRVQRAWTRPTSHFLLPSTPRPRSSRRRRRRLGDARSRRSPPGLRRRRAPTRQVRPPLVFPSCCAKPGTPNPNIDFYSFCEFYWVYGHVYTHAPYY